MRGIGRGSISSSGDIRIFHFLLPRVFFILRGEPPLSRSSSRPEFHVNLFANQSELINSRKQTSHGGDCWNGSVREGARNYNGLSAKGTQSVIEYRLGLNPIKKVLSLYVSFRAGPLRLDEMRCSSSVVYTIFPPPFSYSRTYLYSTIFQRITISRRRSPSIHWEREKNGAALCIRFFVSECELTDAASYTVLPRSINRVTRASLSLW